MSMKNEVFAELATARDEARLHAHLLSMDARERWGKLEIELESLERTLTQKGEHATESVLESARDLAQAVIAFFKGERAAFRAAWWWAWFQWPTPRAGSNFSVRGAPQPVTHSQRPWRRSPGLRARARPPRRTPQSRRFPPAQCLRRNPSTRAMVAPEAQRAPK